MRSMNTVQKILSAIDKLANCGSLRSAFESYLKNIDHPVLLAALPKAIAYAEAHPGQAKSVDDIRPNFKMDLRVEIKTSHQQRQSIGKIRGSLRRIR
jgi:hypothetical protein